MSTAYNHADHPEVFFCQRIQYDRSKGFCGYLYEGMRPVRRAVMVLLSDQATSRIVQAGTPYIVFVTGNEALLNDPDLNGKPVLGLRAFATAAEAIRFAEVECTFHKCVGERYVKAGVTTSAA